MAPLLYSNSKKLLLISLLFFFLFLSIFSFTTCSQPQLNRKHSSNITTRTLLELETEPEQENSESQHSLKKKPSSKNQTKLIKPNNLSKNQTKTIKSNNTNTPSKNQTKPTTKLTDTTTTNLKKLNSTIFKTKKLNSTSKSTTTTNSTKSLDLIKAETTKFTVTKTDQQESKKPNKKQTPPTWFFDDEDTDFVSDFKDLPMRFQQTLIPDLEKISTTSKAYITKTNQQITKNFKPYVGNKYAPTIATLLSCTCVLLPLLLASLLFNKIKAYFSLQKLLIFIQAYLSIYFSILCFSSLITGLEPLKFFYSTSQSTYLTLQIIQTLAYVFYLLLLLMYLVLVFSTENGLGSKFMGLAQTFVGFSVGLHYYMTVFHKVVLRQPPKTNWKVHGIYATCFFVIGILATAER